MKALLRKRPGLSRYLLAAGCTVAMGGCASQPLALFQNGRPRLEPEKYFAGYTHSWGLFETRSGAPRELLATETSGRLEGGVLRFEQNLTFGSGKKMHRSWLIVRTDANHYTATGTGISGNAFHLDFTLDAVPGNPLDHVHMSQWMYLQSDGVTLINRDTLTKAGVIVAEITECFEKGH
jgi:hypothetical protein